MTNKESDITRDIRKLIIIPDEEININDFNKTKDSSNSKNKCHETNDSLNSKKYVDNLKKIITGYNNETPLTIGLFGSYGSGKSSIIKTAVDEIKEEFKDKQENSIKTEDFIPEIKFVNYDAWKYSKDSFRRTFLTKTVEKLDIKVDIDNIYTNQLIENFEGHFLLKRFSMFFIPFLILILIFVYINFNDTIDLIIILGSSTVLSLIITLFTMFITIMDYSSASQKTITEKPRYFSE